MTALFEPLPWDSGRFGFKVARWHGPAGAAAIAAAVPDLRVAGIRLLYIFSPASGTEPDPEIVSTGAMRVDRKTVFARDLEGLEPVPAAIRSFPKGEPSIELRELAFASGAHSRFRVDPEMPVRCFEALYGAWILRSAMREIADEVLVYGEADRVQGMVTIRLDGAIARIGLIAVDEETRGRGWGTGLIRAAEAWAAQHGARCMEIVTQGTNRRACALYVRCGYRVGAAEDVYHLWIAPEAP